MTSFIAADGSGRSTNFIPAVPAAWSVTTIAFIVHLLFWGTAYFRIRSRWRSPLAPRYRSSEANDGRVLAVRSGYAVDRIESPNPFSQQRADAPLQRRAVDLFEQTRGTRKMFPSASSVGFPRNASCHAGGYWAEPAAVPVGWDDESAAGRCHQLAAARNARQSSSAH